MNFRRRATIQVIPVHAHVHASCRNLVAPDAGEQLAHALGQRHAAALDADQHDISADLVTLGDFVRDACQRPLDGRGIQDDGGFRH